MNISVAKNSWHGQWGQDKVHFLTGLTGNKLLNELARITINSAESQYKSTGNPVKRYYRAPLKTTFFDASFDTS